MANIGKTPTGYQSPVTQSEVRNAEANGGPLGEPWRKMAGRWRQERANEDAPLPELEGGAKESMDRQSLLAAEGPEGIKQRNLEGVNTWMKNVGSAKPDILSQANPDSLYEALQRKSQNSVGDTYQAMKVKQDINAPVRSQQLVAQNLGNQMKLEQVKMQKWLQAQKQKQAENQARGAALGSVLGLGGAIVGGMYGGPAGATAGGMAGSGAGSAIGG